MHARLVADAATLRQNVEDLLTRVLAGGETDLVPRLVHPDFVNHEASSERRHGPKGAAATSQWLRSCFGDLSYEIHHIFIDDHMTAAYVTMSRTHEGGLPPGLPATTSRSRSSTSTSFASPRMAEPWSTRRADTRALGPPRDSCNNP
jgi:hypothetical protein